MADKKGSINTKKASSLSWFKNVGKSLGYSAIDIVEYILPNSADLVKSNKDAATELFDNIKTFNRKDDKKLKGLLSGIASENVNIAKSAWKNALEDIKSGKFYNVDREKDFQNAEWSMDGDGLDLDFSDEFEDSNFDDDFDKEEIVDKKTKEKTTVVSPKINIVSNINKNNPMVKALNTQTDAIIQTTEATLEQDYKLNTSSMILSKQIGEDLNKNITSINDNLGLIINFYNDSMNKYIGASLKYYEDTSKFIVDFANANKPTEDPEKRRRDDPSEDLFINTFDIKGYLGIVKKQFGAAIDNNLLTASIKQMLQDDDTLKMLARNPLSFIPNTVMKILIPQAAKSIFTNFDKSLGAFFPALAMKLNKMKSSDNPIFQLIGSIFGVKTEFKTDIDKSLYKKGPIPFDGVTKKAITEVIPGYLSRILTALVGGRDPLLYDYDKGKFKSLSKVKDDFEKTNRGRILNSFEYLSEIKDRTNAFKFENEQDKKNITKRIEDLYMHIARSGKLINPNITTNKEGIQEDQLGDMLRAVGASATETSLIRQIILSLKQHEIMQNSGKDVFEARRNNTKMFYDIEENPDSIEGLLFNNLYGKPGSIKNIEELNKELKMKRTDSIFLPKDEIGNTTLTYLRSIEKILLQGVVVYLGGGHSDDGGSPRSRRNAGRRPPSVGSELTKQRQNALKVMNNEEQKIYENRNPTIKTRELSEKEISDLKEKGITAVKGINDIDEEIIGGAIEDYVKYRDSRPTESQESKNIVIGKFLTGSVQEKYNILKEKMNKLFAAPIKAVSGIFDKLNNTMYEIIFGKSDKLEEKKSLFGEVKKFFDYLKTKVYEPIKDFLFGKDGLFTRIKQSEFIKGFKSFGNKFADYVFGTKNADGFRSNGLMSGIANEFKDLGSNISHYFTGKEYVNSKGVKVSQSNESVFGYTKSIFKSATTNMKDYFFGPKVGDNRKGGIVGETLSGLGMGFQSFFDAIFGPKRISGRRNPHYNTISQLNKKIKERAPKSLAYGIMGGGLGLVGGGSLGFLGSLFLPGGPIGGAIIGTTVGFLSQSDRFKDFMFGTMDLNTRTRISNGIISKSTQDFFKKNKTALFAGSLLGGLKGLIGFGFLPSFIIGGPIGGALLGMAAALGIKSNYFQNLMFGKTDKDGNKSKGLIDRLFKNYNKESSKKKLGTIGAGIIGGAGIGYVLSNFGVLGAFAFGPISGAIAGAAAGIALTSKTWTKALFGESKIDKATGEFYRKGGLLTKFTNMVRLNVIEPFRIKLLQTKFDFQNWFDKKIVDNVVASLFPIKHELKRIGQGFKNIGAKIGDRIVNSELVQGLKDELVQPILKGFNRYVFKPFKRVTSFLFGAFKKVTGTLVSLPFLTLRFFANRLFGKHKRQGIRFLRSILWGNVKESSLGKFFTKLFGGLSRNLRYLFKYGMQTVFQSIRSILSPLKLPFQGLGLLFKGLGKGTDLIRGLFGNRPIKSGGDKKAKRQELADELTNTTGFFRPLGHIIGSYINPFSAVRRAGRGSEGGASYMDEMKEELARRKQNRRNRQDEQKAIMDDLNNRLNSNSELARKLGYDNEDEHGVRRDIYRSIDKQMKDEYGSDWKKKSKFDRDRYKDEKIAQITNNNIEKNTGSTVEEIKNTNKILNTLFNNEKRWVNPKHDTDSKDNLGNTPLAEEIKSGGSNTDFNNDSRWVNPKRSGKKSNYVIGTEFYNEKWKHDKYDADTAEKDAKDNLESSPLAQQFKTAIDYNEHEESKKENKELKDKEKKESIIASKSKSYGNLIKDRILTKEKERDWDWRNKVLDALGTTVNTVKNYSINWGSIFGKKGLIAGGLILALPYIIKFFKDPLGSLGNLWEFLKKLILGDTDPEDDDDTNDNRTTSGGERVLNQDAMESVVRGTYKTASWLAIKTANTIAFGNKITNSVMTGRTVKELEKNNVKGADALKSHGINNIDDLKSNDIIGVNNLKKLGIDSPAELSKLGINSADDLISIGINPTPFNLKKLGITKEADTLKYSNKSTGNILQRVANNIQEQKLEAANPAYRSKTLHGTNDVVKENSKNMIKKFIVKVKEMFNAIGLAVVKRFPKATDISGKILGTLGDILSTNALAKYSAKITSKMVGSLVRTAPGVNVAFVGWGLGTGAFEAGRLFGVDPDNVDGTMRIISSVLKGVLNFSFFFLIDLLNDICVNEKGIDFLRILATLIYSVIMGLTGNAVDALKLKENQDDYKKEWEEYNKAGKEADPNFKGLSFDAYIDMDQPSVTSQFISSSNYREDEEKYKSKTGRFLYGDVNYMKDKDGNIITDKDGNNFVERDQHGEIIRNANPLQNLAHAIRMDPIGIGTLYQKAIKDRIIYKMDDNGKAVINTKSGEQIRARGEDYKSEEEIKKKYGKYAYVGEDGYIYNMGIFNYMKKTATSAAKSAKDLITNSNQNARTDDKYNFDSKSIFGTFKGKEETEDDLNTISNKTGNYITDLRKTVDKWEESKVKDAKNKVIVNEAKKSITVKDINELYNKGLANISTTTASFIVKTSLAVNKWNKENITDENGKPIIDEKTKRTVTVNGLTTYLNNALPNISSKVGSFMSNIINGISGINIKLPGLGGEDLKLPKDYLMKDKNNNLVGMGPTEVTDTDVTYKGTNGSVNYSITSKFGPRWGRNHNGVDFGQSMNTEVPSFTNGEVVKVLTTAQSGGYGNMVVVRDDNNMYNMYAHLNKTNVKVGDKITEGTIIGLLGSTGNSTGPHLHYEVRGAENDKSTVIEPLAYLKKYTGDPNATLGTSNVTDSSITNSSSGTGRLSGLLGFASVLSTKFSDMFKPLSDLGTSLSTTLTSLFGNDTANDTTSSSTTSSSSDGTVTTSDSIVGNDTTEKIWNFLKGKGLPNHAIAGIMGNLYAESSMIPNNLQQDYEPILGHTDDSYTKGVDDGSYSNFVNDEAGYGLAQWTYHSRKQALLDLIKSRGVSVSDLGTQLDFLWHELVQGGYVSRLNNTKSVKEASDIILYDFENPGDKYSKSNERNRFSEKYYNKYAGVGGVDSPLEYNISKDIIDRNNIKSIGGVSYITKDPFTKLSTSTKTMTSDNSSLIEKVIDVLLEIASNTGSSVEYLRELKDKEFNNNTAVITGDNMSNPMHTIANNRRNERNKQNYSIAKQIAQGV